MFESTGTVRYSPKAASIPERKWWVIIDCCQELCRYYRHLWNYKHRFGTIVIQRPAWNGHISVICDEPPSDPRVWESHAGEDVSFAYEPILHSNGQYFWLNVVCDRATQLRAELGLSPQPFYPFHLTVGIDLEFAIRRVRKVGASRQSQ